jgi:hypothetical protein
MTEMHMRGSHLIVTLALLLAGGTAHAEEYAGVITKLTDDAVTIKVVSKDKKAKQMKFKLGRKVLCEVQGKKDTVKDISFPEAKKLVAKSKKGVKGTVQVVGKGDEAEARGLLFTPGKK